MAESALEWWLRDKTQHIHNIQHFSLLDCQRSLESFLMTKCGEAGAHRAAVVELCRSRNLLRVDASERDENGETGLIALAARGGSADDVRLLVAAGADVGAFAFGELRESAMHMAAQQGHGQEKGPLLLRPQPQRRQKMRQAARASGLHQRQFQ